MNRKYFLCQGLILIGLFCFSIAAIGQENKQALANIVTDQARFHPGDELTFRMILNEPLPQGAHFDVRLSPIKADQEIDVPSGEPINKERTEFRLHTKLPDGALAGEWHIKIVWLFLAGASWTNNTLSTNDMQFNVEGRKIDIPTKATATIVQSR
jgi:hypothetical protein